MEPSNVDDFKRNAAEQRLEKLQKAKASDNPLEIRLRSSGRES